MGIFRLRHPPQFNQRSLSTPMERLAGWKSEEFVVYQWEGRSRGVGVWNRWRRNSPTLMTGGRAAQLVTSRRRRCETRRTRSDLLAEDSLIVRQRFPAVGLCRPPFWLSSAVPFDGGRLRLSRVPTRNDMVSRRDRRSRTNCVTPDRPPIQRAGSGSGGHGAADRFSRMQAADFRWAERLRTRSSDLDVRQRSRQLAGSELLTRIDGAEWRPDLPGRHHEGWWGAVAAR